MLRHTLRVLRAVSLAVAQLADPALLRVLVKTLALTLVIFVLVGTGLWWILSALLDGWTASHAGIAAAAATLATILGGWLLFRAVAIGVLGLFAEDVVVAVERRHYPDRLDTARPPRLAQSARMSVASVGRAIGINLLMAPIYILLLPTGVGTPIAFAAVNGWLLGRDLGEMVAARHMPRAAIGPWLAATRGRRMAMGLAVTGLFMVPVVNLVAPILGAALATHLFHGRNRR